MIGAVLLLIGLLPPLLIFWLGTRHMYTVGFAVDTRGEIALTVIVLTDLSFLAVGIYLLSQPNRSRR
jgi:hypothetical protein